MATNDKTGPDDEAVEGSWSPKRTKASSEKKADKNGSAATPDPEVLAGEIEKTREELAETLDAIADKVSPKRVVDRKKQAAKDGASDAADSVKATASDAAETVKATASDAAETLKETAASASEAVKSGVAKAKDKVGGEPEPVVPVAVAEVPVEVAPTPGALADTAAMPVVPVGAEEPVYTSTLPPPGPSRAPMLAGAGAATLVTLFLLRRRRRRRR